MATAKRAPNVDVVIYARWFDPKRHQRAVIFTDDQQHDSGHVRLDHVPLIYTLDLARLAPAHQHGGVPGARPDSTVAALGCPGIFRPAA